MKAKSKEIKIVIDSGSMESGILITPESRVYLSIMVELVIKKSTLDKFNNKELSIQDLNDLIENRL